MAGFPDLWENRPVLEENITVRARRIARDHFFCILQGVALFSAVDLFLAEERILLTWPPDTLLSIFLLTLLGQMILFLLVRSESSAFLLGKIFRITGWGFLLGLPIWVWFQSTEPWYVRCFWILIGGGIAFWCVRNAMFRCASSLEEGCRQNPMDAPPNGRKARGKWEFEL